MEIVVTMAISTYVILIVRQYKILLQALITVTSVYRMHQFL